MTRHPEVGFAPRLGPDVGYDGLSHPCEGGSRRLGQALARI